MPYYDTIEEDLTRAKQILAEGRDSLETLFESLGLAPDDPLRQRLRDHQAGGTLYGKDLYGAYKLLESFVTEIETMREAIPPAAVLEAVVYAYEGKPVAEELNDHGMVRRAMKFLATHRSLDTCACGTTLVCPDLGCDLNKAPA